MKSHALPFAAIAICLLCVSDAAIGQQLAPPIKRPNVLMIVADDMNWDSPGCFGGAANDLTPHIDRLASEGMRFWHAYVNVSICTPSRSVMLTGLYPSNNGAEGFQRIRPGTETLPAALNKAGYVCGIIGKPLRQQELFRWSVTYRWPGVGDENRWGRDPEIYRMFARRLFTMSEASGQPFFLMANSHDPHRPFAGGRATREHDERAPASRTIRDAEVRVPGFLPDLPAVRQELAEYCTSVRRLDDMVGAVLDELVRSQKASDTIVIFLSDHGMPFPGAKFNCYVDSVRTPLIVRWPGVVHPGSIDRQHMIAAVDLQPTILEAVGVSQPQSDGRSFLPLLKGETQSGRDHVFAQFYHIHGSDALPMRAVLTKESAYVFNPWSDAQRRFARLSGAAFEAMQQAAGHDPKLAARIRYLRFRAVEEYFDLTEDPHCLENQLTTGDSKRDLDKAQRDRLANLQTKLREWMVRTNDLAVQAFENRNEPARLEHFVQEYRKKAAAEVEALKPYEKQSGYRF